MSPRRTPRPWPRARHASPRRRRRGAPGGRSSAERTACPASRVPRSRSTSCPPSTRSGPCRRAVARACRRRTRASAQRPGSGCRRSRAPRSSSRPRADGDDVLLLEARLLRRAAVPLVAEGVERRVEIALAPVLARVGAGRDGRAVAVLEVLAVVARLREGRDVEVLALERVERDAVAEHLGDVLLAAPQRRWLRAGRRRRRERAHRPEERA